MDGKKAFVFDTNFIIQNQKLDEVIDNLKEWFSVYVTQVSIDERIAQQCRDLKSRFDEAENCKNKFRDFATVSFTKTYDEKSADYQKGIQKNYKRYFGEHIISYSRDGEMFSTIIDRCNKKLPPFLSEKNASDKGFKDCLLWLSILAYFKDNGEDEIILVTDDKSGFRNNIEFLQNEFHESTGKTIEIHPNTYYQELLKQHEISEPAKVEKLGKLPNLDDFRKEIEDVAEDLRRVYWEDDFGDPQWSQTFTTSVPFNKEYIRKFFEELSSNIFDHIFERSVPASKVLDYDGRITDCGMEIPMQSLEKALRVYEDVIKNYSQYSDPFFEAVAKILNRNYRDFTGLIDDGELPF